MGPAVNAPKLRREATQLCSSLVSRRHASAPRVREVFPPSPGSLGSHPWVSRSSWGRVGADQESTVPSPNEPIVAHSVPGRG